MNWKAWIPLLGVALLVAVPDTGADTQKQRVTSRPEATADKHRYYRRPVYHPPGYRIARLPRRHVTIHVHNRPYFYDHGVFYRPFHSGGYVVVGAPLGARVRHLPPGYVSFWLGSHRYFYANFTYYLWDGPSRQYVVVEAPEQAESTVARADQISPGELYVYPRQGQSEQQRDRDRFECYQWAVDETGFDPVSPEDRWNEAADYRRALTACLEGRGYTVK
ncbi:MAG: DUF6515 family protein [Xanthomonadales bacterium]|nr:DUF6515 family protein [Xanthomonadales bacterium]